MHHNYLWILGKAIAKKRLAHIACMHVCTISSFTCVTNCLSVSSQFWRTSQPIYTLQASIIEPWPLVHLGCFPCLCLLFSRILQTCHHLRAAHEQLNTSNKSNTNLVVTHQKDRLRQRASCDATARTRWRSAVLLSYVIPKHWHWNGASKSSQGVQVH